MKQVTEKELSDLLSSTKLNLKLVKQNGLESSVYSIVRPDGSAFVQSMRAPLLYQWLRGFVAGLFYNIPRA